MKTRAFISHNDDTGSGVVKTIHGKLVDQTLDMDAFLSTRTPPGADFVEAIMQHLPCTDMVIFVIDSEAANSTWMKWEHDFSQLRDIPILYITFPNANLDDPKLGYINRQSVQIRYDYRDDVLCDQIQGAVANLATKTKGRNLARASIKIVPDQNSLCGKPSWPVTVSGSISGRTDNKGRAYLHVPNSDPSMPPCSTAMPAFTIGKDGRFSFELKLPSVQPGAASRVWYVEVRAGPAACVVPIRVDTGEPPSQGGTAPRDAGSPAAGDDSAPRMPDQMQHYSEGVLESTPRDVGGWEFPRPEADKIRSLLDREDRVVLTGDKGSGKSVVLCQLYKKLAGTRRVLLVRCDDFHQPGSLDDLDRMIGGGASVLDYLAVARGGGAKTVLLLDSLDAVSRNTESMSLFRRFVQKAWSTGNVQTVCTVRTYDYEYSPEIGSVQWGTRIAVDDLPVEILDDALVRIGNLTVPDELKKILHSPLRLKIFHMIASRNPGANFANIKSEVRLYQEHWREYVDKSGRRDEVTAALLDVAGQMIKSRRTAVPRHAVAGPAGGLDVAYSSGILGISGDHTRFFHHAYLDYVASKLVLRDHPDIVTFLAADPYNVFLLPTLAFALSLVHDGSRSEYLRTVMSICESDLLYYWKIAAVRSLAELDGFSADEIEPMGSLLTSDYALQRHFLLEAGRATNPFWFRVWSGRRMEEWSAQDHNARMLLDYLTSLSGHKYLHGRMIRLISLLLGKESTHPLMRQKAVEATAKMPAPGRADWYVKLSGHPDARVRTGVLPCLKGLLDTDDDVDKAAEAFANIVSYQETSREPTEFVSDGTLRLVSNKMQDNALAVWGAGEVFPKLLAKRPVAMIKAAIKSIESAGPAHRGRSDIMEDHSRMWYGKPNPSGRAKILKTIAEAMPNLLAADAPKFAPLLAGSRPAVFHRILLDALTAQPGRFADAICKEVSRPGILVLPSLRSPARESIRLASPHLARPQAERILASVMALGEPEPPGAGRPGPDRAGALKSYYLSAFDRSALSPEHLAVLERWPPAPDRERAAPPSGAAPGDSAHGTGRGEQVPSPAQAVKLLSEAAAKSGKERRTVDLGLLELAVDHAGDGSDGLDAGLADRMRALFLGLAGDPDPGEDAPSGFGGGEAEIDVYPTVRGLAARGLVRLCARTRDKSLLPAIKSLSEDRINTARSAVAEELERLFGVDADLARGIAVRYCADPDRRVLFYMPNVINLLAKKYPDDALAAVRSILERREAAEELAEYLPHALLFLALTEKMQGARELLQEVLEDTRLPTEIRRGMPFALKEAYLFWTRTQDDALGVFSRLLDSKEQGVREAASFFLLSSIGDAKAGDAATLIKKLDTHLDKIALETDERPYNSQIVGTLVGFLKDYWHHMPKRALVWLEKISGMPYAAYQPAFMEGTVAVLNGMFRSMPSESDRNRCLTVLDSFVKAGWPKAVGLLREMGRPD